MRFTQGNFKAAAEAYLEVDSIERKKKAEEYYRNALEIDPGDARIHYNYARLLREMNRYNEAEKH